MSSARKHEAISTPIGYLVGYEKLADHGFALPCFGQMGGNIVYVAGTMGVGDPAAVIEWFEPYQPELLEPVVTNPPRLVHVGDAWIDVFIWDGRVYTGSARDIWDELAPERETIGMRAPLSLLSLAQGISGMETGSYARQAFDWLSNRYGSEKASRWRSDSYLRGIAVRSLRRLFGECASDGRIRWALQNVELRENGTELILTVPSVISDELDKERSIFEEADEPPKIFNEVKDAAQFFKLGLTIKQANENGATANSGFPKDAPAAAESLEDLRALIAAHPFDSLICTRFAKALIHALSDAVARGDLARLIALLDELHLFSLAHPSERELRVMLAKGLLRLASISYDGKETKHRDAVLRELRRLSDNFSTDAPVAFQLALALGRLAINAAKNGDLLQRDVALRELRALAAAFASEPEFRGVLAGVLLNLIKEATGRREIGERDSFLDELRALVLSEPTDAFVRRQLCSSLAHLIFDETSNEGAIGRQRFLQELRELAESHPTDAVAAERLAMALVNMLDGNEPARNEELVAVLRRIVGIYSPGLPS